MVSSPPQRCVELSQEGEHESYTPYPHDHTLITIIDEQVGLSSVRPTTTMSSPQEEDPFSHIDQMMYLEQCGPMQVQSHPAFEHLTPQERALIAANIGTFSYEEMGQVKLAYLAGHLSILAQSATYNLVEIGKILAMGNITGLHKLTGCKNMYEWARTALSIEPGLLSLALEKYNAWLYIREYGFGVEVLTSATPSHLQLIRDLARDIHRQQEEIRRRKVDAGRAPLVVPPVSTGEARIDDERGGWSDEKKEEEQELREEVVDAYRSIAQAEIRKILALDPADLLEKQAISSGALLRPHLSLTVTYNPRTGNLEGIDPRTGARTGAIFGHLDEEHLRGLAKGQMSFSFRLHLADESRAALVKPSLTLKELGNAILEHCPPDEVLEEETLVIEADDTPLDF